MSRKVITEAEMTMDEFIMYSSELRRRKANTENKNTFWISAHTEPSAKKTYYISSEGVLEVEQWEEE